VPAPGSPTRRDGHAGGHGHDRHADPGEDEAPARGVGGRAATDARRLSIARTTSAARLVVSSRRPRSRRR
jgi:hypothetical protein